MDLTSIRPPDNGFGVIHYRKPTRYAKRWPDEPRLVSCFVLGRCTQLFEQGGRASRVTGQRTEQADRFENARHVTLIEDAHRHARSDQLRGNTSLQALEA